MKTVTFFSSIIGNVALLFFLTPINAMDKMPNKTYVTPDNIKALCRVIYQKAQQDNFKPELILGLARGGFMPMAYLCGEKMFNNKHTQTIPLTSYNENGEQSELRLLVPLHTEDYINYKSILVVDDLVDSGNSFKFIVDLLKKDLTNTTIKTAALFYKKRSIVFPDYYAQETADWIVFPSEVE